MQNEKPNQFVQIEDFENQFDGHETPRIEPFYTIELQFDPYFEPRFSSR